jgi:hypothetical protein
MPVKFELSEMPFQRGMTLLRFALWMDTKGEKKMLFSSLAYAQIKMVM